MKFSRKCFCRIPPRDHFSHDVFFPHFADQLGLQPKINLFGGAMVKLGEGIHKLVQFCVVMEIRWKLRCQVVAAHVST